MNISEREQLAFDLAYLEALKSPDPSTQNGAIIIDDSLMIGKGSNSFTKGIKHTNLRLERPLKYSVVEHAERAAIFDAIRCKKGNLLEDATMVALWAACADCARAIIEVGIKKLVTHSFYLDPQPVALVDEDRRDWDSVIEIANTMFREAGVEVVYSSYNLNMYKSLLFNGEFVMY